MSDRIVIKVVFATITTAALLSLYSCSDSTLSEPFLAESPPNFMDMSPHTINIVTIKLDAADDYSVRLNTLDNEYSKISTERLLEYLSDQLSEHPETRVTIVITNANNKQYLPSLKTKIHAIGIDGINILVPQRRGR